jgi:FkbM family methyltransferase
MINLALKKPALQSSTSRWSLSSAPDEDAGHGNDGDISRDVTFHTTSERDPGWQVDLGSEFLIRKVAIFNRREQAHRLNRFSILKSLDGEHWREIFRKRDNAAFGHDGETPYVVDFPEEKLARFLRVRLNGQSCLHFRECQVFGVPPDAETRERLIQEEAAAAAEVEETLRVRNGELVDIEGFSVLVDHYNYDESIVRALEGGHYEGQERALTKALIKPTDRVIEVGTAVGVVSMTAAVIVGPQNVLTFDANPDIVADARANFERNGLQAIKSRVGVLKNREMMGSSDETADFYIARAFWASRLNANEGDEGILRKVRVPVFCLEEEIASHDANFLICDIEGGEAALLYDADLSAIKTIIMETHYWSVGEAAIDGLMRKLVLSGFSIHLGYSAHHVVVLRR